MFVATDTHSVALGGDDLEVAVTEGDLAAGVHEAVHTKGIGKGQLEKLA